MEGGREMALCSLPEHDNATQVHVHWHACVHELHNQH